MDQWPEEFGSFDVVCWGKTPSTTLLNRICIAEFKLAYFKLKKIIQRKSDMVILKRTTSYGFLALSGIHPSAIAQQGKTRFMAFSFILLPLKKDKCFFKKATIIHIGDPL
jgi:hypothetical protein